MEICSASKWTPSQVGEWLGSIELPQYKSKFEALGIDGSLLLLMTEADLLNDFEIHIRLHRYKILESLKKLVEEPAADSENSSLEQDWGVMLLLAVEGQCKNKSFEIGPAGSSIGRNSGSNDIVINESFVSRKHCEIKYKEDSNQFLIKDVGSTTGTFIMVKEKIEVDVGMMFQMGLSEFRVLNIRYTPYGTPCSISLIGYEGPARDLEFVIERSGCSIGRDVENSIAVSEDSQLSSKHGRIFFENEAFFLEDLGSTNKTWRRISGEGLVSADFPIYVDDCIKIGSTVLQVQISKEPENKENFVESPECRLCKEVEANTLCYPCGHLFCFDCLKAISRCPTCRKEISDKVKVYK
jgi:pSer/pThr/pTyr-binding forkhead associated (FHA) protein